MSTAMHPCAEGWMLPPPGPRSELGQGILRTNLRELCARPGRIEHHLMVVARIGAAQLEVPTASEPLAFAHVNLSDEYVVVLPTGHAMLDAFPFRVFVSDPTTRADVLRLSHRVLELVLHPYGFSHWPGRLRPPYAPMAFPPGMRRAGLTLVFCAGQVSPPPPDRELWITAGLEEGAKPYTERPVPTLLVDLKREASRRVAQVSGVDWELLVSPSVIEGPRGGYLTVVEAAPESGFFATDLIYVPQGAKLKCDGVTRALWMSSQSLEAEPPPPSWHSVPPLPFAVFEAAKPGTLPLSLGALTVSALNDASVTVSLHGQERAVPRYWLARTLFRVALHGYRLGYLETYEDFFYDDTDGRLRLGLHGVGAVEAPLEPFSEFVKQLYYAVAPPGYVEDLR